MKPTDHASLFTAALGLRSPWRVDTITFDETTGELHLQIGYASGTRFACPDGSGEVAAYDTRERTWRHLNFWQHKTFITAQVPRVRCRDGSLHMIDVPWARAGSGFTLLFESSVLLLMRDMPVAAVARLVGEHDTRLWRLLHRYVDEWKPKIDMSKTTTICVDETASRRGHEYITIVVDGATRKVLFACEGRDKSTLSRFADILVQHGGDPRAITAAAIDMGNPYIGGMRDNFPNASIVFDRFHVTQWMNKAVDRVRRSESRREETLTGTKFLFMKRHDRLNKQERIQLKEFIDQRKKTAIAYQLRTLWDDFYKQGNKEAAKGFLKAWVNAAIESKIVPMMQIACRINAKWQRFISWFDGQLTTAINEGINSLIQAVRSRARGYRNTNNFIDMCYFLHSGMPIIYHTK